MRTRQVQSDTPLNDALFEVLEQTETAASTGETGATSATISEYIEQAIAKSKFAPNPLISDEKVADLPIGKVSAKLADKIIQEYGVDISDMEHVLRDEVTT